jgi:sodium pump decarboxylase gamma subunit
MSNLGWGLQMTVLGMGLVFCVLALLWGLLRLVLALEDRGGRAATAEPAAATAGDSDASARPELPAAAAGGLDPDLVAAIAAAVVAHKAIRRQEAAPSMRTFWPGSLMHASRWVGSGRVRQIRSFQRRGR